MRVFATLLAIPLVLTSQTGVAGDTDVAEMNSRSTSSAAFNLPDDPTYLAAVKRYGECAVRGNKMNGGNSLRSLPFSKQSIDDLLWLTFLGTSCDVNGKTPAVSPVALRGVIAEYHLTEDFSLPNFRPLHRARKIFKMPDAEKVAKLDPMTRNAVAFILIGECVAAQDAGNLEKLFKTELATPEENRAFSVLEPTFAKCVPTPSPQPIGAFELRGYLAEGAYRYAVEKMEAVG